ncbi:hypothetical protein QQ045_007005 [Rhodiola kirilowii]
MSTMSFSTRGASDQHQQQSKSFINKNKFKGVRRRKWGKWVSEIRVPGTSSRLWLGSYSTAEAAAAAHDVAQFYLRSSSSSSSSAALDTEGIKFNFPEMVRRGRTEDGVSLSPRSVQKAASDAGMAVDAAHRVAVAGGDGGIRNRNDDVLGDQTKEAWEENWSFGGGSSAMNGGNFKGDDLNISVDDYL